MPYETRPYIPFTFFLPNPGKSYTIRNNTLTGRTLGVVFDEVALPPASIKRQSGVLQAIMHIALDRGDVIVTDKGGTPHVFRRIRGVTEFRSALNGTHHLTKAEVHADPDEWKIDLKLRPVEVIVPAIPTALYKVISKQSQRDFSEIKWHVGAGAIIKAGEVVAEYTAKSFKRRNLFTNKYEILSPKITMPWTGKITRINSLKHYAWSYKPNYDKERPYGTEVDKDNALYVFQYAANDKQYDKIKYSGNTEESAVGFYIYANANPYSDILKYVNHILYPSPSSDNAVNPNIPGCSLQDIFDAYFHLSDRLGKKVVYLGGEEPRVYDPKYYSNPPGES